MPENQNNYITYGQMNIINDFRNHGMQLSMWTWNFINSIVAEYGGLPEIFERLYSVPAGFRNALAVFYGNVQAGNFANLLYEHIIIIRELVNAMREGNQPNVDQQTSELYNNADRIAEYLAQLNPYWTREQWQHMLYEYIGMIIQAAISLLSGDYGRGIAIFDNMNYYTSIMADFLSRGTMQY